jgi:hypothetical protein
MREKTSRTSRPNSQPEDRQPVLHATAQQVVLDYLSHPSRGGGVLLRTLVRKCLPYNRGLLMTTLDCLARSGAIHMEPQAGDILVRLVREREVRNDADR